MPSRRSDHSGARARRERGADLRRAAHDRRVHRPDRLEDALAVARRASPSRPGTRRSPGASTITAHSWPSASAVADRDLGRLVVVPRARLGEVGEHADGVGDVRQPPVAVLDRAVVALGLEGADHHRAGGARHRLLLDRPRERDQRRPAQLLRAHRRVAGRQRGEDRRAVGRALQRRAPARARRAPRGRGRGRRRRAAARRRPARCRRGSRPRCGPGSGKPYRCSHMRIVPAATPVCSARSLIASFFTSSPDNATALRPIGIPGLNAG